jgi:hypothetical protein
VYQLQCADCPLKYIGQTGPTFKVRFKEHIWDIKNNGQSSKFAQQILDTTHEYNTIDKALEVLYIGKKGRTLDTYEKFHIYEISKQNLQLNDNFAEIFNFALLLSIPSRPWDRNEKHNNYYPATDTLMLKHIKNFFHFILYVFLYNLIVFNIKCF